MTFPFPFDLDIGSVCVLGLGVFLAGYVRGYSGFGSAALFLATGALVVDPLRIVAVAMAHEIFATLLLFPSLRADIEWRRLGLLLGAALAGLLPGLVVVLYLDVDMLRAGISLIILAMCGFLLAGWRFSRPAGVGATVGVGLFSGFINATSIGGLPVAAFMAAQREIPAEKLRANMAAYLLVISIVSLALASLFHFVRQETWIALCWSLPLFFLAIWLGARRFTAASPESFRLFAIILLMGLSVMGLVKSIY